MTTTDTTQSAEPVVDATLEPSAGNAEAAKYRRQLRETETERDQLRDQLTSMRRAHVDQLATAANVKPAALWATGVELDALVAEDGTINVDLVTAAIDTTRETLGIPVRLPLAPSAEGQGDEGSDIVPRDDKPTSWGDALANN